MCDIMSASLDQYGSTPSHSRATAICHRLCYQSTKARAQGLAGPGKTRRRKAAAALQRLLRNFHFPIFVAAYADTPNPGSVFCLASMFRGIHEVSNHHFDDLANGARFKKRHCWGVRIWFDQPRKER